MSVYLVPDDPRFDLVGFSVSRGESYVGASTPTTANVEDGSTFSDHVVHMRPEFKCEVDVTNTPALGTFYESAVRTTKTLAVPTMRDGALASTPVGLYVASIDRPANRVQEMLERLETLRTSAAVLTIVWDFGELTSYLLSSVSIDRGERQAGFGRFALEFKPFTIVSTEQVSAPQPKEPRAAKLQSKGAQPGSEKSLEEMLGKAPGESWARAAGRWASSQIGPL